MQDSPKRTVHCEDAIAWLAAAQLPQNCSLVTSMPDISEFPSYSLADWKNWFISTAKLILLKTPPSGVTIFFQSDIRHDGHWVDKGFLCQLAAAEINRKLIWHKIACRTAAGQPTFGRAGYSHILCFSEALLEKPNGGFPDVLPSVGEKSWERGMGLEVCVLITKFIASQTDSVEVVNPFCGHGGILAAANSLGLGAIGIERSNKRAAIAKTIQLDNETKSWLKTSDKFSSQRKG